jgi:hypothetical protein
LVANQAVTLLYLATQSNFASQYGTALKYETMSHPQQGVGNKFRSQTNILPSIQHVVCILFLSKQDMKTQSLVK